MDSCGGTATASYQNEGAWNEDGKGESIWDRFTHTPGKVRGGVTGDVACDQYHLYAQDIAMAKRLNMKSQRFSISWPRIQPTGVGAPNMKGIDYYSKFVDTLLAAGDTAVGARCITGTCRRRLRIGEDGRIATWRNTLRIMREYWRSILATGLRSGPHSICRGQLRSWDTRLARFPPQRTSFTDFLKAAHTLALAQAEANRAVKAASAKATVGSAYEMAPSYPKTDSDGDRAAADRYHAMNNVFFLEATMKGRYPNAFVGEAPLELMGYKAGDDKLMLAPLDWVGFHYYGRRVVSDASKENFATGGAFSGTEIESNSPGGARSLHTLSRRDADSGGRSPSQALRFGREESMTW